MEEVLHARRLPNRNFLTLPEVASARGVTRVAILNAIKSGKLRASRVDGRREWYIHVDDARDYLREFGS